MVSSPISSPAEDRRTRTIARHTGIFFVGQILRALSAALLFVVAARALGPSDFGVFVSTVALVAIAVPFGSIGSINLMMRRIAVEPDAASRGFCSALALMSVSGAIVLFLLLGLQQLVGFVSATWYVFTLIGAGDLLAYRLAELAGGARQALDWMYGTAFFPVLTNFARVGALWIVSTIGDVTLTSFSIGYFAASLACAIAVILWTLRCLGTSKPEPSMFLHEWRDGLHFSVGLASQTVYNDVDKLMLARLASDASAGVYASAYRAIDLACVPLRAIFGAAYVRFFRAGEAGLRSALSVARQICLPSLGMALVSSLLLWALAEALPLILGDEFEEAVGVVRWLAFIPVLRAIHYLAADSLTGARMQSVRTACQLSVAVLNILLNLILIPRYGIEGAVASSIAADAILALSLWTAVARSLRRPPADSDPTGALQVVYK